MRFHIKAFTSLFLTITFVALSLSGAALYVAPRCRVAEQIGWTVATLAKGQWESMHINAAVFFVLAAAVHLVLNWPVLWCYVKKKGRPAFNRKWELLAALVLGGLVLAGSMLTWPPFHSIVEWHEQIKDSWGRPSPAGSDTHTDALTLQELSEQMGLATEQLVEALETEGMTVSDAKATIAEVAEKNHRTPNEIRMVIRRQFPEAGPPPGRVGPGRGLGSGGGRGMGRGRSPQ